MLSFFQAMDDLIAGHLTPHNTAFRRFLTPTTLLAGIYFISALGICSVAVLAISGFYGFALGVILSLGGTMAAATALKYIFKRTRPTLPLIEQGGHALPSGHAAASLALYGYLSYVLIKLSPTPLSFFIAGVAAIIILAIGFSRIYLRVHHTSDVLLGYFIGAVFLILTIVFF